MTNIIRAELYRLLRRRTLVIGGVVAIAFSFLAAFAIFAAADSVGPRSVQGGTTLARLAAVGRRHRVVRGRRKLRLAPRVRERHRTHRQRVRQRHVPVAGAA